MRIQKVEKLNHARFHNFSWSSGLNPFCDETNILFGWNGSGKTTFSRFIRSIEQGKVLNGCTHKIKLDSTQLTESSDLNSVKNKIKVFNGDYVDETLRGSAKIPYIFFAGKEAVDYAEDEKKLEGKKLELSKLILPLKHDDIAKNTALLIKGVTGINGYRKELTGAGNYSSFDKTDFEKRVADIKKKVTNKEIGSHTELVLSDINTIKTQLINTDRLAKIDADIAEAGQWLVNNVDSINITLQSEPKQEKSERINLLEERENDWVKEGVAIHFNPERRYGNCLFCGSNINNAYELLSHFSDEVISAINSINEYLKKVEHYSTSLAKIESPNSLQKSNITLLRSKFDILTPLLREKHNAISTKKDSVDLDIENIKKLIVVTPVDATTTAYAIESHYVAEKYDEYITAHTEHEKVLETKKVLEAEVSAIDSQVSTLKQKAKSTHEPASALNRLFKVVFPYRSIEITDSPDGTAYALKRDGDPCPFSSLSDGEKNFIALAYFLYSINDAQNKLADDGVVVIDDPVSSLDKQAIFQIFSMIVNEIKTNNNRQYFILTHNLDFLGHLKECFNKKIGQDKIRLFSFNATSNGCTIEAIHPLLRDHRSDYYYVFSVLYKFKDNCDIENSYLVVNLLRRWLETFLEFKFSTSGDLQSTLESAYIEAQKATKDSHTPFSANHLEMYRFINHGSHGFQDTESMDDSILVNAQQRIQDALQLVKILDSLHYKKLEQMANRL